MIILSGYLLTEEQANLIAGKFFNADTFFNPLLSIDNDWFIVLTNDDLSDFDTIFDWVLQLPYREFEFQNESV